MNSPHASQWSRIVDLFLSDRGGPTFHEEVYRFENEAKTARFIHGVEAIRTVFIEWLDGLRLVANYPGNVSERFRCQGNTLFRTAEHVGEAALLYTKAIYTAAPNSIALAQAHANRAAAVYKLGEFQAAYNDCECALKLHHPKPETIRLRKATCAASLRDVKKLEECTKKLDDIELGKSPNGTEQHRTNLENVESGVAQAAATLFQEKRQRILRSETRGRYVVTDEPVAPNEVIMTEEAAAFVPIVYGTHAIFSENCDHYLNFACENCAENDITPFPCYACRNIAYCSPKCRDDHAIIHGYECSGYQVNLFSQVGIGHLALRSLLAVFNNLLERLNRAKDRKPVQRAEDLWPFLLELSCDGEVMGLCTNYHAVRNSKDIVHCTLTASMLCCYLRHKTEFFHNTRDSRRSLMESEGEWEIIVTALLLRLISQMICNGHTIEGFIVRSPFSGCSYKAGDLRNAICQGSLFSAIYPRTSLYNHACNANFRNKFDRAKLSVVATTGFAVGQEVLNCYGVASQTQNRRERMTALKSQYGFTCDCAECLDVNDHLYLTHNHVRCKLNSCRTEFSLEDRQNCPRCGASFDDAAYNHLLDSLDTMPATLSKYDYIVDLFWKLDHVFPPVTTFRYSILTMILSKFLKDQNHGSLKTNEKLIVQLLSLAKDLLDTSEAIYGVSNLQFIQNSIFLLDLMALHRKVHAKELVPNYDMSKIESSVHEFLTGKMKTKILNYIKECGGSGFCQ